MKKQLSGSSVIRAVTDQVSCDVGDEAVILHLKSGEYFGLDAVGARVWNLIQEPRTVNDIQDVLLDEYDVERERCERDLLDLLNKMAEKGLIEVRDEKTR